MNDFPDWAQKLLQPKETGPRPHTLNLSLKLAHPEQLPLMLLDVAIWQPTIQRALKDLAFLHYARFVPSWDGTAVVVTTEFDGPMKPYVMDFVIALGDVFNQLLSYVQDKPPLPVQEHPDEFWAYVEKWNRVPFFPRQDDSTTLTFPPSFDYPVHSAYPTKSVIDITGPRDARNDGLRPALDRRAARVDLSRVQGNILRGYPARAVRHLMLRVTDAAKARAWLAELASNRVQDAQDWGPTQPAHGLLNVAFTFEGMKALLPNRTADLERFPTAFREGAAARVAVTGDDVDTANKPECWRFNDSVSSGIHVVLSLHRLKPLSPDLFAAQCHELAETAVLHGLGYVTHEDAEVRSNNRIYFNYRDGISEHRIAGQCPVHRERPGMAPASSPGEFLLGRQYHSIYAGASLDDKMPEDLADQGCYGALRLMEQDVYAFAQLRRRLARQFNVSPGEAGARLLGRWPDGQPLSQHTANPGRLPPEAEPRNDFDYAPSWEYPRELLDHDGARCPLDAHIRRTNPRSHHAPGMRHTRRLLRRGMPAKWRDGKDGKLHAGLMGLFLCGDLERQYEFILRQWVNGGESRHSDVLSGTRAQTTPFRWGPGQTVDVEPLVHVRGSLYLFYPGMDMLRSLPERNEARPNWVGSALASVDDFEALVEERLKTVPTLAPKLIKAVLDHLLPIVSHSQAIQRFTEAALQTRPTPPGKTPQVKVGAQRTHFLQDPCRTYRRLRANHHDFFWEPDHGAFLALRRADVKRIISSDQEFVQAPSGGLLHGIITLDGDAHRTVRQAFWESMEQPLLEVPAHLDRALQQQLGKIAGMAQFDFVRDLSNPVLSTVFWDLFGLPQRCRDACSAHAAVAMRQFNQPGTRRSDSLASGVNANARLFSRLALELALAMLLDAVSLGHGAYKNTLLGGIAARTKWFGTGSLPLPHGSGPERTVDFPTAVTSLLQFVLAGHLAPQLLVGSATRNFLAHDAQPGLSVWAHLASLSPEDRLDPLKKALDESRRFDPPVTIIQRYAKKELEIGGITVEPGMPVFAVAASANRDGPASDRLDEFIWDRTPNAEHYSLGLGPHECIGRAMQQSLVPRMLSTLMSALPGLRLVDPQAAPAWIDNVYFRGLEALPVMNCKP